MSYSFNVKGATKDDAINAVRVALDKVVEMQPVHAFDRHQAFTAAIAMISALPVDKDRDVAVTVSGWVMMDVIYPEAPKPKGANVCVTASLQERVAEVPNDGKSDCVVQHNP